MLLCCTVFQCVVEGMTFLFNDAQTICELIVDQTTPRATNLIYYTGCYQHCQCRSKEKTEISCLWKMRYFVCDI